jgi:hypothetical protein
MQLRVVASVDLIVINNKNEKIKINANTAVIIIRILMIYHIV